MLKAETSLISAREKALQLCGFALEKKAQDLILLEVGHLTTIAEYFVICSGRSDRQVQSIADGVREDGRPVKIRPFATEGAATGHWILMDFSDVLVHIFYEPTRKIYGLEALWRDARVIELPEPYATLAKQFRADEPAREGPRVVDELTL